MVRRLRLGQWPTIHYIERRRFMNAAEVYHEHQLGEQRLEAVNYYLRWPIQYEELVKEAPVQK